MKYETVKEAAERLGVTARTVQKWAAAGKIPGAMKAGRDWQKIGRASCRERV